jgi:hypothetical protein
MTDQSGRFASNYASIAHPQLNEYRMDNAR